MVTPVQATTIEFQGSAAEKRLAQAIFRAFELQGRFMSVDTAIRLPIEVIREYARPVGNAGRREEDRLGDCGKSPGVRGRADGESVTVVTTRLGHPPVPTVIEFSHSFDKRFMTPKPKPEAPAAPVRARVRIDPSWTAPETLAALGERFDESGRRLRR